MSLPKSITKAPRKPSGKSVTFVRYGGLSSVPQDGYTNDPNASFHSPPARRGIYAFVHPFVDTFLLGGREFDQRRMEYVRDGKGEIIATGHPEYDKIVANKDSGDAQRWGWNYWYAKLKDGREAFTQHKSPNKFKYNGDIWHHLDVPNGMVTARKGSWVKTDMSTYAKALQKEIGRYTAHKKRLGYDYCIDHTEVFIEKV